MFNDFLDKFTKSKGIQKYEDMNPMEKETYKKMLKMIEAKQLTLSDLKGYISAMKLSIATQLADTKEDERDLNILLKARLKNYSLLEEFLNGPEKARQALKKYMDTQDDSFDDDDSEAVDND